MSKIIIALIIILSAVPVILFLIFGQNKAAEPLPQEELPLPTSAKQEARPDDSPSCAICRQITESASQEQCLKDFACSI